MLVLGIESSCDDTSVALLECSDKGCFVVGEKTASQIDIHKKYSGVVPELAGRAHAEKIVPLVEAVLNLPPPNPLLVKERWNIPQLKKPDVIAVASGPGLITGLLVGVETARTLSYVWNIPLVRVNHIEGHIHSTEIPNIEHKTYNMKQKKQDETTPPYHPTLLRTSSQEKIKYPALALIASGGHTELIYISKQGQYKKIGATKDDAAGECFDKVAKLLNLPYPGGPQISKLAEKGNPNAIKFPRPMINKKSFSAKGGPAYNWNFSFSGLKTSALYWLRDNKTQTTITINDFCASFQQAIVDVLVTKTIKATKKYQPKTVILGGGVSANKKLKEVLKKEIEQNFPHSSFLIPHSSYSMDNASMIAVAGYYKAKNKDFTDWKKIKADPNWEL